MQPSGHYAEARQELIRLRLHEMDREHRLTPENIVAEARANPDSVFHDSFDFSNLEAAAMAHWLDQARRLIRVYFTEVKTTSYGVVTMHAFVRDPAVDLRQAGYVGTVRIRDDREKCEEVIAQELKRIASLIRRTRQLGAGFGIDVEDRLADLLYAPPPPPTNEAVAATA